MTTPTGPVTVTVTPIGQRTSAIECTDCGVLGLEERGDVPSVVHQHLIGYHKCKPETIDITHPEGTQ